MSDTIIKVQYNSANVIQWKGPSDSGYTNLTTSTSGAPTITVNSSGRITFQFIRSQTGQSIEFKPSSGGTETSLPTSNGPTVQVTSGNRQDVYFAKEQTTKVWYVGYVAVSDDDSDLAP